MASTRNRVKNESKTPQTAEDKNLEEWARKLAAKPPNQIGLGAGGNFLASAGQSNPGDIPPHSGFDLDSAIGRFTWHTVENDKYVPALFRNGELFCSMRMAKVSLLESILSVLPQEIYSLAKYKTEPATPAEAKLLTYINSWHCNGFYGSELFTTNDRLIPLKELEELYYFLSFTYKVLSNGGANTDKDFSRCGFVKVNESLIPYAVLPDGEKGVPLFYFEGHIDILKAKAMDQGGWGLTYLKICCKVQGVRKDLMSGDCVQIIRLNDLKAFFPKRSVFVENCWPPSKGKSLIPKLNPPDNGYNYSKGSSSNWNGHTRAGTANYQMANQQKSSTAPTASSILKTMTQQPNNNPQNQINRNVNGLYAPNAHNNLYHHQPQQQSSSTSSSRGGQNNPSTYRQLLI